MKIVKLKNLKYIPASHENPKNPGVLKKVLFIYKDLLPGRIQMINWAKLGPDKSFSPHFHEDMEEIFIILSGKVRLTIDNESKILEKGDAVIIPCKVTHKMVNVAKGNVFYLAIGLTLEGKGRTINV